MIIRISLATHADQNDESTLEVIGAIVEQVPDAMHQEQGLYLTMVSGSIRCIYESKYQGSLTDTQRNRGVG